MKVNGCVRLLLPVLLLVLLLLLGGAAAVMAQEEPTATDEPTAAETVTFETNTPVVTEVQATEEVTATEEPTAAPPTVDPTDEVIVIPTDEPTPEPTPIPPSTPTDEAIVVAQQTFNGWLLIVGATVILAAGFLFLRVITIIVNAMNDSVPTKVFVQTVANFGNEVANLRHNFLVSLDEAAKMSDNPFDETLTSVMRNLSRQQQQEFIDAMRAKGIVLPDLPPEPTATAQSG
jgi:hypothetical protein